MIAFDLTFSISGDKFHPDELLTLLDPKPLVLDIARVGDLVEGGRFVPFENDTGMLIIGYSKQPLDNLSKIDEIEAFFSNFISENIDKIKRAGAEELCFAYQIYSSDNLYSLEFLRPDLLSLLGEHNVKLHLNHLNKTEEEILKLVKGKIGKSNTSTPS